MKKTLLSALVAVLGFTTQATAQTMLATLFHDNDIKTFYGAGALREAHAAATHGDVITLSSGTFTSTKITKAITLRGAGMEYDSLTTTEPTIIEGTFEISITAADSVLNGNSLTMEGIFSRYSITIGSIIHNPQFVKCTFFKLDDAGPNSSYNTGFRNASFINCIISGMVAIRDNGSATFVNSFVTNPSQILYTTSNASNFEFQNCVIRMCDTDSQCSNEDGLSDLRTSIFRNCIIYTNDNNTNFNYDYLHASCQAYNCIGYNPNRAAIFLSQQNTSNTQVTSMSDIFKTWTGGSVTSFKTERLELTDEAKTKYLGTDGTEVGIYGGSLPFVSRPSNPQITKLNVASKSTADGKLSVDIEVKAAE